MFKVELTVKYDHNPQLRKHCRQHGLVCQRWCCLSSRTRKFTRLLLV